MKNCNKDRKVSARAATKERLVELGAIDQYLKVLDRNLLSKEMKKYEKYAKENYGVDKSLYSLDNNGDAVVFATTAFHKIDAAKGIFYKENKYLKDQEIEEEHKVPQLIDEFLYNGDIYPSEADMEVARNRDMEEAVSYMPEIQTSQMNPTNYPDYIAYKELSLKKIEKRLANVIAARKFDKTSESKQQIADLSKRKDELVSEIYDLKNSPDIFEKTMSVFNKDLDLIDRLLSNEVPSLEEIHYAEEMVTYFDSISDYSTSNKENNFVITDDIDKIELDVREALNKIRIKILEQKNKINEAKQQYLMQAIEESEKLKSMFPNTQVEEIKRALLEDRDDIGLVSMLFATVDKDFAGKDSILAQLIKDVLEKNRSKTKSYAAKMIQTINDLQPRVKAKLLAMGQGVSYKGLGKLASEVSYDMYYQKNQTGNKTGRIVHKYSDKWFKDYYSFMSKNSKEFTEAILAKDFAASNKVLADKFEWLNEKSEFIEIGKLPEVISNPQFSAFSNYFNTPGSQQYKADLIAKIGKYNYDKLVQQQTEYLEDYTNFILQEQLEIVNIYGVKSMAEVPVEAQHRYNIIIKRNDPFDFLDSVRQGQSGKVDYMIGNTGNQYQSHIKYNTFIPKENVRSLDAVTLNEVQVNSGYYDENFSKIEQDPDLLVFWEALIESAEYMNSTLSDSNTRLNHTSLLRMSKSMTDILFSKNTSLVNKTGRILGETGQTLKDIISTKEQNKRASDVLEVNKGGIETIQSEVTQRYEAQRMNLSVLTGKQITNKTMASMDKLEPGSKAFILQFTELSEKDFKEKYGNVFNVNNVFKEVITNQVMEEQTFNLPLMMRAYLDVVSEYKAQKDSLSKINIFKDLYDNVKLAKSEDSGSIINKVEMNIKKKMRTSGLQDQRVSAQLRMEHWVNREVKGVQDKEYWHKFERKNLTAEEKEYAKSAKQYLKFLQEKIDNSTENSETDALIAEQAQVQYMLDNLGSTYTTAAIYNAVVNRFGIFIGLGWNIPSQVFNRFQGWYSGMINDTGRYWTSGNFYDANAFINRKGARYIPGISTYRNEIRKTKLMMEKLNIIQDATNEIDRARRESGVTGLTKKINPFYLTEYTEWHNQTPQILAILMDHTIKGGDKEVKVFDGSGFPAFNIVDGKLQLKPEFRTEENIATWEDFSNNKSAENKAKMSATIVLLNGDYSKTGSTLIKSKALGKTVMMFKTWLSNALFLRFAYNQSDLALGMRAFDGAYTGVIKNDKTSTAGTAALLGAVGVSSLMGLPLVLGGALATGLISYQAYRSIKNRANDTESFETMKQLSSMGKAITKKMIGLPVNTVSGKDIIKAYTFDELNITTQDRQNLAFVTNEIVGLLWLTLFKLMIKGMLGDDDEEEPKTIDGKNPNPFYGKNLKSNFEEGTHNILENTMTRMISDANLFINPKAMFTTIATPAGLDSWFKKVDKLSDGLERKFITDEDILTTGPNAGESKFWSAVSQSVLPGIMKEYSKGEFNYFGFKEYTKKEWEPGEVFDTWYDSDYKKARKSIKAERAAMRDELTEYWSKEYDLDNIEDPAVQLMLENQIKKKVKAEVDVKLPLNIRRGYDENQDEIE